MTWEASGYKTPNKSLQQTGRPVRLFRAIKPSPAARLLSFGVRPQMEEQMGVWGAGNFQQDYALDFVWRSVQQPLIRQVEKVIADPACAQADDPESGPIMAAVELLALLTEQVNAVPPNPADVARWRDTFLPAWDRTSAAVYFRAEDAAARREVLVATFQRLASLAAKWHERQAAPGAPADS